jgi:hypothetical protein
MDNKMDKNQNQVKPEYLLQKIGELTIIRDMEAAQYQQKIQKLEETIKELSQPNTKPKQELD